MGNTGLPKYDSLGSAGACGERKGNKLHAIMISKVLKKKVPLKGRAKHPECERERREEMERTAHMYEGTIIICHRVAKLTLCWSVGTLELNRWGSFDHRRWPLTATVFVGTDTA